MPKIVVLFSEIGIVVCVSEYTFFCFKRKNTHVQKQKPKEAKENRKIKETKRKKEKENVVVANNIHRKSNGIQ